jgi:hypothetical protein
VQDTQTAQSIQNTAFPAEPDTAYVRLFYAYGVISFSYSTREKISVPLAVISGSKNHLKALSNKPMAIKTKPTYMVALEKFLRFKFSSGLK